jgi:hypothetical protein
VVEAVAALLCRNPLRLELEVTMSGILGDIKAVQAEAEKEIRDEAIKAAKGKIKESLSKIAKAKSVVAQLERDHEVLLQTIAAE